MIPLLKLRITILTQECDSKSHKMNYLKHKCLKIDIALTIGDIITFLFSGKWINENTHI